MFDGDLAHAVTEPEQEVLPAVLLPARGELIGVEAVHDVVDDAAQQVAPAVHIAVERHRLDTAGRTQPSHGQSRQTVAIDQPDRGVQNELAAQPCRLIDVVSHQIRPSAFRSVSMRGGAESITQPTSPTGHRRFTSSLYRCVRVR